MLCLVIGRSCFTVDVVVSWQYLCLTICRNTYMYVKRTIVRCYSTATILAESVPCWDALPLVEFCRHKVCTKVQKKLTSGQRILNFAVVRPVEKHYSSCCDNLCSKKSITATAGLLPAGCSAHWAVSHNI